MPSYVFGGGLTYPQYLQAKSFLSDVTGSQKQAAKSVSLAVSRQTREIIASQEALAREHIQAAERLKKATQEGFEQLSWEIQDVGRGISELNATFQWGFGEMVAQLGRLNSAVSELVKIAKTPVQTLANNHFQIARDAYRQGLLAEAIEELGEAISVYKLEWRFHYLAGTIHLGDVSAGVEFMDLPKAEAAFLLAARYSKADSPQDAARSLLAAGWAAYCQGKMGPALSCTEEAIALHPGFAEALFQSGKIYMALGEPENALPALGKAIEIDKVYAIKAADDGDYQRHERRLSDFLDAMRREKMSQIEPAIRAALKKCELWLSRSEEARKDPVVVRARSFLERCPPLWDLLDSWSDLAKTPAELESRARQIYVLTRTESQEGEYSVAETYFEEVPPNAGLFRRLAGPKMRTRNVMKPARTETITVQDGMGCVRTQVDFVHVRPGDFHKRRPVPAGGFSLSYVRISRPYLLAATPITAEQYLALIPNAASEPSTLPVAGVSWYDAVSFCNALSRQAGLAEAYRISAKSISWVGFDCEGYRLPTEAEWAWACIGGRKAAAEGFYWQHLDLEDIAWFKDNSGGKPHPVREKQPNPLGLYDMLGNVSEWVYDWYISGLDTQEQDPVGPEEHQFEPREYPIYFKFKITRGGAYSDPAEYLREGSVPQLADPKRASPTIGFRVARTLPR